MTITNANKIKTGDKITVADTTSTVTKVEANEIFVDYNGQDNHIPVWQLQEQIDCGLFFVTRDITAEQALKNIASIKTTFLGQTVEKHATPLRKRRELMRMAQSGEISPREYKRALDITWPKMSQGEKDSEYQALS